MPLLPTCSPPRLTSSRSPSPAAKKATGWYGMSKAALTGGTSKRLFVVYNSTNGSNAGVAQVLSNASDEAEANVVTVGNTCAAPPCRAALTPTLDLHDRRRHRSRHGPVRRAAVGSRARCAAGRPGQYHGCRADCPEDRTGRLRRRRQPGPVRCPASRTRPDRLRRQFRPPPLASRRSAAPTTPAW